MAPARLPRTILATLEPTFKKPLLKTLFSPFCPIWRLVLGVLVATIAARAGGGAARARTRLLVARMSPRRARRICLALELERAPRVLPDQRKV